MKAFFTLLCFIATFAFVSAAARAEDGLMVRDIIDGDTVILNNGDEVRLYGIQAPKLSLGRPQVKDWPYSHESKQALSALVQGRSVVLRDAPNPRDRHGRRLAEIRAGDISIQEEMVKTGNARVYSFADNSEPDYIARLLMAEQYARTARLGLWALPVYAIQSSDAVGPDNTFQLVDGVVQDVVRVKANIYINFGDDWRRDFTVRAQPRDLPRYEKAGKDLMALKGKKIRVRGWVFYQNGPMMELTHPEQFQIIKD